MRFSFLCLFSHFVDTDKMIFPNLILFLHIQGSVPTNYLSTDKQTTNTYNDESNVLSGAKQTWRIEIQLFTWNE